MLHKPDERGEKPTSIRDCYIKKMRTAPTRAILASPEVRKVFQLGLPHRVDSNKWDREETAFFTSAGVKMRV